MLCVIIPTLNAAQTVPALLTQLCADTDIRMIVADGGSQDDTLAFAAKSGAIIATGTRGRGTQLRRGVNWAAKTQTNASWYLILHADCQLPDNWRDLVDHHIKAHPQKAAYFGFGANARGFWPRVMEFIVGLRDIWPLLPYGDQGLLIARDMYDTVGGYPDQALFEDVDIIRAIKQCYGRKGLRRMKGRLISDVSSYARDGYGRRTWRNIKIILAYSRGTPIEHLIARYK